LGIVTQRSTLDQGHLYTHGPGWARRWTPRRSTLGTRFGARATRRRRT
jgi:hypothetical protein